MSPPPGWFADSWRLAPWRWWDGYQWTPYTWPAAPTHIVDTASLANARSKEIQLLKWAKVGLGYPARLSPARGVGSWFLPLANFWQPYYALSDLLPPDHPMRPFCLRAWLSWYGAAFVNLVALSVAFASDGAAVVVLALGAVLVVYTYVTGWRLIDAVHEDHTRQLSGGQY